MLAQREISKNTVSNAGKVLDAKKSQKAVPLSQRHVVGKKKSTVAVTGDTLEDASITAPSISGTITKTYDESFNQFDVKKNQKKSEIGSKINDPFSMSRVEAQNIPAVEGQKKVQFSLGNNDISMGNTMLRRSINLYFELVGDTIFSTFLFLSERFLSSET